MLQSYDWPGNVRELQNATERALILTQNGLLQFDLPRIDPAPLPAAANPGLGENGSDFPVLTEFEFREREKLNMLAALKKTDWRIHGRDGAAELLGIKPTTLISRIKKMGLKRPS